MEVTACGDGRHALERWRSVAPDVVLLDLTLPGLDGLQVLEQARAAGLRTPVLILTARGTVGDRVIGLNTGADDYLPKPFDLDELEARLRALHRRRPSSGRARRDSHSVGALRYDRDSGAIYHRAQVLELTPRELALLQALMARPGHAVSQGTPVRTGVSGRGRCAVRGRGGRRLPPAQEAGGHRRDADDAARPGLPAQGRRMKPCAGPYRCAATCCWASWCPWACSSLINAVSLYRQTLAAVNTAYDRTLLASAKSIGEQLDVRGLRRRRRAARHRALRGAGGLRGRQPEPHVLPRLRRCGGEMVSGFGELPFWRGTLPDRSAYAALVDFYDDALPRRAGARRGAAAARGQRERARHGRGPGGRNAGAARRRSPAKS